MNEMTSSFSDERYELEIILKGKSTKQLAENKDSTIQGDTSLSMQIL